MKKALKIMTYVVPLLIVTVLLVFGIWHFDDLRTLTSVKMIEGTNLYTMEYFSDYHFDEFLQTGASDNNAYYKYINSILGDNVKIGVVGTASRNSCTAFTYKDSDGNQCFARNLDNTPNPVVLVVTNPSGAYKSISAVNMNCMGYTNEKVPTNYDPKMLAAPYFPTDGMNEKGISISMLQVNFARKQKENSKTTINAYAVIRLVLDYAKSIDEAVSLIREYNIYFDTDMMVHFMISDSEGHSALIEFVNGKMYVINNTKSYQVASNFNNSEEMFNEDGYVYFHEYSKWLATTNSSAYDSDYGCYIRYDYIIDNLYNRSGIISDDDAFALLEDVASPKNLQYSIIYNLSTLEATIITDNDWETKTSVGLGVF